MDVLKRAKIVLVETSFYELYKGQPLFDGVYELLRASVLVISWVMGA